MGDGSQTIFSPNAHDGPETGDRHTCIALNKQWMDDTPLVGGGCTLVNIITEKAWPG
jgi:hypothetical protein